MTKNTTCASCSSRSEDIDEAKVYTTLKVVLESIVLLRVCTQGWVWNRKTNELSIRTRTSAQESQKQLVLNKKDNSLHYYRFWSDSVALKRILFFDWWKGASMNSSKQWTESCLTRFEWSFHSLWYYHSNSKTPIVRFRALYIIFRDTKTFSLPASCNFLKISELPNVFCTNRRSHRFLKG